MSEFRRTKRLVKLKRAAPENRGDPFPQVFENYPGGTFLVYRLAEQAQDILGRLVRD